MAQVNLTSGKVVNQFSLGTNLYVGDPPFTASYLAAVPGQPNSVAVVIATTGLPSLDPGPGLAIFDSGVPRGDRWNTLTYGLGPICFRIFVIDNLSVSRWRRESCPIDGGAGWRFSRFNTNFDFYRFCVKHSI